MKSILTIAFAFTVLFANAQIKVYTGGKVAVGTTSTVTPTYLLDLANVSGGDANIGGSTYGFRISGTYMLWHNNKNGCIYVGGGGSSANTGSNNIFIGSGSGSLNVAASENVAVGYQALKTQDYSTAMSTYNVAVGNGALFTNNPTSTSNGNKNTAVGHNAGYQNTLAYGNVFIGFEAAKSNKATSDNVAIGYQALYTQAYFATPFSSQNTAVGYQALYTTNPTLTTNGYDNTAMGYKAGFSNTTGTANLFCGDNAGYTNATANGNAFLCHNAGYFNLTGAQNVALGLASQYYNSTGSNNTSVGYAAGFGVSGNNYSDNSFFGYKAGYNVSNGNRNTCVGYQAGFTIAGGTGTQGYNNTCVGYGADVSPSTSSNKGAFGYNAVNNQGDNTIFLGNSSANSIYVATGGGYYTVSDARFKTNVKEDIKGLPFIKKLRPVTYKVNAQKLDDFAIQNMSDSAKILHKQGMNFIAASAITQSGFLAQEVAKAAKDLGFGSTIVSIPADSNVSAYGINYAEIVVPLVKAVQELSKTQDSLISVIATLKGGLRTNDNGQGKAETTLQIELASREVILYNAEPNPFTNSTIIRYFIPENITGKAYVGFYDMYGKEIKKLDITEKGFGKIEANTENLAAGIYSYSIVVDGKVIDTKKMLRSK